MTRKICIIKGDDASPQVVTATVDILEQMSLDIELLKPLSGGEALAECGDNFPQAAREAIDSADCTLFGAGSDNSKEILSYLKWGKRTFANHRPMKYMKGMRSPLRNPDGIDFDIVRENLEGLYPNSYEGDITGLSPLKVSGFATGKPLDTSVKGKYAIRIITEENTRDIAEAACQLAIKRKAKGSKGKVTVAGKYNNLPQSDGLFCRIAKETVARYPALTFQQLIIDNFLYQMIRNPHDFDVVVLANEYGDMFSDGAAALIGGLGLAPSSCIGKDYAYFEPIHGTAPDIAGKNIINPTATILSAAMMLDYLDMPKEAERLENAVYAVYTEGKHLTVDQGGKSTTADFCQAVKANL